MRIDIEPLIDEAPIGSLQVRVLLLCALAAYLDGFDVSAMASATPSVAKEWHVVPGALSLIVTAAVMGIAVSSLLVSPLGDYFGRRAVLLASFALVGLATLMASTTTASNPSPLFRVLSFSGLLGPTLVSHGANQLFFWRFLTGLGLGASLPNALALGAEYAPKRLRTALVALLACAISLGSASSNLLAPTLIQAAGWRAIFTAGGVLALLAWVPLLLWLPESPRFLVVRGAAPGKIAALLAKLGSSYRPGVEDRFTLAEPTPSGMPVGQLLTARLAPATLLLWLVFFFNLGLLYLVSTWLPTLLNEIGLPLGEALHTAALFQLGGVAGGLVLAALIKRTGPFVLLIVSYTLGALALLLLSLHPSAALIALAVLFTGNGINGAQVALNALSATLYPTSARASGVGWALGIGRFGAILGPLIVGTLMFSGASAAHVIWLAALPTLGCAAVIALLRLAVMRQQEAPAPRATTSP
jgi:AAHS family 4-hydroxybenzoate transporter-like MFS transporter